MPFCRQVLPALLIAALASAASAQPTEPQTRYTELIGGACKFVSIDKETNEELVKRGPGHGGASAETLSSHTTVSLGFRFSRRQRADSVVSGYTLGDKLEWRGLTGNQGFEPYAVIVRVTPKDADTMQGGGPVLAVLRFDPREMQVCLAALVDGRANPNPNELARATADRIAPAFLCGSDKPSVAGATTRWTSAVLKP
jgi:hypothetical protein